MGVSDLMRTPAVTCAPTSTLCEVGQLMERRQVGAVIVIDRDIVLCGVAMGRSAEHRGHG